MASQWYCRVGDGEQEYGPYLSPQLKQMCRDQQLLPEHQVRQGEAGRWILAGQVQGLFAAPPSKPLKQAAPLALRVSDSSLGDVNSPQVLAAVSPAAAKPPPPRGPVAAPASVTPVAPSGTIPMGVAVASVPAGVPVTPGYATSIPAGVVPAGFPVVTTAQPAAASYHAAEEPSGRKKDQTGLYVTIGLAACVVLLVGVGAAVGLGFFKSKPGDKQEVAATDSDDDGKPAEEAVDPETVAAKQSAPAAAAPDKGGDAKPKAAKSDDVAKAGKSGKPNAVQQNQISDVSANKGWHDVSSLAGLGLGNVKIMVTSAWFGGGAAAEASGDSAQQQPPAAQAAGKPRYVYVEVRVENVKGPGIVGYKSWNGAGKNPEETAAVLLDSEGRVCPLVSREQAPDPGRRQVEELAMGQGMTDVLVFEAPTGNFDYLRIALPCAAIGRPKALGFQIPRDKVALSKAALTAVSSPGGIPGVIGPEPPGGKPAVANSGGTPPKKPADPDAPPSIKDLERDIQNLKKKDLEQKEAESKGAQKQEP